MSRPSIRSTILNLRTAEPGEALRYQDFTFSGRWPDPKGMVQTLHKMTSNVLLWQIPV